MSDESKAEPLSAEELAEVEAREKVATRRPWAWESVGEKDNAWCIGSTEPPHLGQIVEVFDEATERYLEKPDVVEAIAQSMSDGTFADADFITHARTDVPRLLATVRARDEEIATFRERLRLIDVWAQAQGPIHLVRPMIDDSVTVCGLPYNDAPSVDINEASWRLDPRRCEACAAI